MADARFLPIVRGGVPPGGPVPFERIAVVGLGPLGAAVALAARQAYPTALVIGVDARDRLETCIHLGAIDVGANDAVIVAEAELILLDLPVADQAHWIETLDEWVPGAAILASLRSDDGVPEGAVPDARFRFIAGHLRPAHPLPADVRRTETTAIAGASWAIGADADGREADRLATFARGIGALPVFVGEAAGLRSFLQDTDPAV